MGRRPAAAARPPEVGASKQAEPINLYVGQRLRERRIQLGMSLEQFAAAMDLSLRQAQSYENGSTRVGAMRLSDMAHVLSMPISYVFGSNTVPSGRRHPGAVAFDKETVAAVPGSREGSQAQEGQETGELVPRVARQSG